MDKNPRRRIIDRVLHPFGGYSQAEYNAIVNETVKKKLSEQEFRLFKAFDAKLARLTSDVSPYFQWEPKDTVNADEMLKATLYDVWLSAALSKIIASIMQLPWTLTVEVPSEGGEIHRVDITETDLKEKCEALKLFNDPHPKEDWSWVDWVEAVFTYWEATGDCYVLKYTISDKADAAGEEGETKKIGLQPLRPDKVCARADEDKGLIGYDFMPKDDGSRGGLKIQGGQSNKPPKYEPNQIVHFSYFNPLGNFVGKPTALAAWDSICTGRAMRRVNRSRAENHFESPAVIESDKDARVSDDQMMTLAAELQQKAIPNKAGEIRSLPPGTKIKEMTGLTDMQYEKLQRAIIAEVSAATGVHSALMGLTSTYNRANILAILKVFFETVIMPKCAKFSAKINRNVLPDTDSDMVKNNKLRFAFDFSGVEALRSDPRETAVATKQATGAPWMTRNEAREKLGMPTLDDPKADELYEKPSIGGALGSSEAVVEEAAEEKADEKPTLESILEIFDPLTRIDKERAKKEPKKFKRWKSMVQAAKPIERRMISALHTGARKERDQMLDTLERQWHDMEERGVIAKGGGLYYNLRKGPIMPKKEFERMMAELEKQLENEGDWMVEALMPEVQTAITAGANLAAGELVEGFTFDMMNPDVQKYLNEVGIRITTEIPETTLTKFQASMMNGWEKGEGIKELSDRVNDQLGYLGGYNDYRAELIARTETISSFNRGAFDSYRQAKVDGTKHWISAFDDRVREWHIDVPSVKGTETPFTIYGPSGAVDMMHPGDPAGGGEQVCNCRCAIGLEPS